MVDNEKRDNLANARRKVIDSHTLVSSTIQIFQLRKFRDEQQQQNGADHLTFISETNGKTGLYPNNGVRIVLHIRFPLFDVIVLGIQRTSLQ